MSRSVVILSVYITDVMCIDKFRPICSDNPMLIDIRGRNTCCGYCWV